MTVTDSLSDPDRTELSQKERGSVTGSENCLTRTARTTFHRGSQSNKHDKHPVNPRDAIAKVVRHDDVAERKMCHV
jgi:hypothetical protein